jgi:hypothetical protein
VSENRCIGSLTTLPRDDWADARQKLCSISQTNKENMEMIDDSLFVLCLDDRNFITSTTNGYIIPDSLKKMANFSLAGGDSRNQWLDKCFQVNVNAGGRITFNFENSWRGEIPMAHLMQSVRKDILRKNTFVGLGQEPWPTDRDEDLEKLGKLLLYSFNLNRFRI